MNTIMQIRANRRNAKKATGPKTRYPLGQGKEPSRFDAVVHGLRAGSVVIPGEQKAKFDQHLERLSAAWKPQDDMEKSLVEQIAVNQWKLARIDRSEARIHDPAMKPGELALAIQARLERSISNTIANLGRYRKQRLARKVETEPQPNEIYKGGLIWYDEDGKGHYAVLPRVRGLDGEWREIPREVLADFPDPPDPA